MIYLKHIFDGSSTQALLFCATFLMAALIEEAECSKIAYKKPIIQGAKSNIIAQEKQLKSKIIEEPKTTTASTRTKYLTTVEAPTQLTTTTTTTTTAAIKATTLHDELEVAETTHAHKTELSAEEKSATPIANNDDEQQQQQQTAAEKSKISLGKENESETAAAAAESKNSLEFHEATMPIIAEEEEKIVENQLTDQEPQPSERAENIPLNLIESQERAAVVDPPLNFDIDTTTATTIATTRSTSNLENPATATTTATSTATTIAAATTTSNNAVTTIPTATAANSAESTTITATTPSNRPAPCTCGVFMTSQIKRTGNPYEPPKGRPVIINELDRTYPCNAVGQKQCQTKCLETIVQHLPNSANILCASLDHDIRKERAYLFIKNCRNQWFNTNLAAGREYCCKNGQPYQCPLV